MSSLIIRPHYRAARMQPPKSLLDVSAERFIPFGLTPWGRNALLIGGLTKNPGPNLARLMTSYASVRNGVPGFIQKGYIN